MSRHSYIDARQRGCALFADPITGTVFQFSGRIIQSRLFHPFQKLCHPDDYFQAIDYPLEKLLANFVQGRSRGEFERSPAYELAQLIIQGTAKDVPMVE